MLCYLRALLFKNSWYHYVILQRWGLLIAKGDRSAFLDGISWVFYGPSGMRGLPSRLRIEWH